MARQKGRNLPPRSVFDRLLEAFKQLPESVQVLIIIGFFLLIFWLLSNPGVLIVIVRLILAGFQLFFVIGRIRMWIFH